MQARKWVISVVVLALGLVGRAEAEDLVIDDFEGAAISPQWGTPVINGGGAIQISSTESHLGAQSIQFDWVALVTTSIYLPIPLQDVNEIYLRFAVKWSPQFEFTPGNTAAKKIWRTFGTGSEDDIALVARKSGTVASGLRFSLVATQMYTHGLPSNLDENVGEATLIETGRWYCFDWHVVGGLGTGVVEGWIDGEKKWDYSGIYTAGHPMTLFDLGGNISPDRPANDQHEWFDRVGLATTPLDPSTLAPCGAGTQVPEPPLAPSGLTVQ